MSLKNFLLLDSTLARSSPGSEIVVSGTEGHHGAKVMRLRVGEQLLLTDAHGYQTQAEVRNVGKSEFTVAISSLPRAAPLRAPRLTLVQALAKGSRDEAAVETATELGADSIIPWQADRCVVQWKGEKAARGREKWIATVRAAVKQSRRSSIPEVGAAMNSRDLAVAVAEKVAAGSAVYVLHEDAVDGFSTHLSRISVTEEPLPEIVVVVGPEGGISEREAELLASSGAVLTRLGTEILRASSAGPAALAALCAVTGRW